MRILLIFLFLPLLTPVPALSAGPKPAPGKCFYVTVKGKNEWVIWSIASSGKASPALTLHREGYDGGGDMTGTTTPVVSPDGKWVAYVAKSGIWIKNISNGRARKVTGESFTWEGKSYPVSPLLSGWSQDSAHLLYNLEVPEEDEDEPAVDLHGETLNYGYSCYDPGPSTITHIGLTDMEFCGWNASDEALFKADNSTTLTAIRPHQKGARLLPLSRLGNYVGQFCMVKGRDEAVVMAGNFAQSTKIVRLNLKDGSCVEVAPNRDWADVNWPVCSPSGAHTAWTQRYDTVNNRPKTHLVVDGKVVPGLDDSFVFRWVDEEKMVLEQVTSETKVEILVVHLPDGQVLDHHPLGGHETGP